MFHYQITLIMQLEKYHACLINKYFVSSFFLGIPPLSCKLSANGFISCEKTGIGRTRLDEQTAAEACCPDLAAQVELKTIYFFRHGFKTLLEESGLCDDPWPPGGDFVSVALERQGISCWRQ